MYIYVFYCRNIFSCFSQSGIQDWMEKDGTEESINATEVKQLIIHTFYKSKKHIPFVFLLQSRLHNTLVLLLSDFNCNHHFPYWNSEKEQIVREKIPVQTDMYVHKHKCTTCLVLCTTQLGSWITSIWEVIRGKLSADNVVIQVRLYFDNLL